MLSLVLPFYVEWLEQISWANNILFLGNYICCAFNSFFKWPSLILLCTKCFQIHSRWYLFFLSIELSYFQQQCREQYRTKGGHYLYIPHNLYNLMWERENFKRMRRLYFKGPKATLWIQIPFLCRFVIICYAPFTKLLPGHVPFYFVFRIM